MRAVKAGEQRQTYHLSVVTECDTRPRIRVVRLDVELHLVALSNRLPADEIFTIVLLRRAISRRLPMSMTLVVQLVW